MEEINRKNDRGAGGKGADGGNGNRRDVKADSRGRRRADGGMKSDGRSRKREDSGMESDGRGRRREDSGMESDSRGRRNARVGGESDRDAKADGRSRRRADSELESDSGSRRSAEGEDRSHRNVKGESMSHRRADGKSVGHRNGGDRGADGKSVRSRRADGITDGEAKQGDRRRGRRRKKKKNLVMNIILAVAFAVFCISAFQLIKICKGYYDGRSEYEKIRDLALEGDNKEKDGPKFQVNFDELMALNPDTVAWLRFDPEPSVINYPVVQGKDNEEYLHKTFSANENTLGTIFLNVDNSAGFQDENSILYGHYMNDGSMFRHLEDYKDQAFWEANPYFYIYTPDGQELVYHIYSVGEVLDTSDTYLTEFPTNDDYQNFLNMTKEVAMYDTGIEVTTADTIVTLSTCTSANNDHRFVVRGVKVRNE